MKNILFISVAFLIIFPSYLSPLLAENTDGNITDNPNIEERVEKGDKNDNVNNEFEMLMEKIRQDFKSNPSIDSELDKFDNDSGLFVDVDYSSIQRTHWPPLVHIDRLYDFAFAYTNPQNKYYKDEALFDKIRKGLEYWHNRNPWCHNWWYNQIAEPQKLGVLLIQMRSGDRQLPEELENKILERMKTDGGDPAKWTGANRTDIALHWIYRACLLKDSKTLEYAMNNVYSPIVYTTKEGFQYDNSNFQHGRQLYIGGYGDEILKGVTQVAMYAHGTRFSIPEDKLQIISKFMRETYYPAIRGKYMLFDVMGRSVSRPGVPDKSFTSLFARRMAVLDKEHANEYSDIIERLEGRKPSGYAVRPFHTHYFRGDYTLHVRPGYTFDVRMVSTRTMRCEYGNGENLKTYFMSDGCTNIVRRGDEYDGIFPVWNWSRIPGVTSPQMDDIPLAKSDWQTPGISEFAGGVSDSIYGVTTYAYYDDYKGINTGARKSWFFFDDEIVCLGSGINSSSDKDIYTTVNQTLLNGEPVISCNGKSKMILGGNNCVDNPQWVMHDSIAYIFPYGGKVISTTSLQTGTWYDINNSINDKSKIEKEVFTLCIDHGTKPQNGKYSYIVAPNMKNEKDIKQYIRKNNINILSNSDDIHCVAHKSLGIYEAVFFNPGELEADNIRIKVDRPCALIIKGLASGHPIIHVADPGQKTDKIRIEIQFSKGKHKTSHSVEFVPSVNPVYLGATQSFRL